MLPPWGDHKMIGVWHSKLALTFELVPIRGWLFCCPDSISCAEDTQSAQSRKGPWALYWASLFCPPTKLWWWDTQGLQPHVASLPIARCSIQPCGWMADTGGSIWQNVCSWDAKTFWELEPLKGRASIPASAKCQLSLKGPNVGLGREISCRMEWVWAQVGIPSPSSRGLSSRDGHLREDLSQQMLSQDSSPITCTFWKTGLCWELTRFSAGPSHPTSHHF